MIAPELVRHDGIEWIEIGRAARLTRIKATALRADIANDVLRSVTIEGKTYIPLSSARRLRREESVTISARSANRPDSMLAAAVKKRPADPTKQDVLPMSRGRAGSGWLGQRPR